MHQRVSRYLETHILNEPHFETVIKKREIQCGKV